MRRIILCNRLTGLLLTVALFGASLSQASEPIRLAFIDPLSGTFASVGSNALRQLEFAADYYFNSRGGVLGGRQIEIHAYDNKQSPGETRLQFRRALGEDIRIIFQGNSSAAANALNDAITRHNRRNPGQEVLQINYTAIDPVLTNENCSFWHFRFDAHVTMKLDVLTDYIATNSAISSVYLIGQDYSFGHEVADTSIAMLKAKRPDLTIAGNDLHPIGQVKDFSPYVSKIAASGADAVITGNFGADMVALARAIMDAGLEIPIYTFYAAYDGITATLGEDARDQVFVVHNEISNPPPSDERVAFIDAFKQRHPDKDVTQPRVINALRMVVAAMEKANSTEPYDIALALEDMHFTNFSGEEIWMRPQDHQAFQALYIAVHTDANISYDADGSGFGLYSIHRVPAEQTIINSSCQMQRPQR